MKDSSPSGAFCFFTLFNLQGARRLPATIRYYIVSESICQALFEIFRSFFFAFFSKGFCSSARSRAFGLYHHSCSLSRPFLFFLKTFCLDLLEPRCSLAGGLYIIAGLPPFVNTFFHFFLTFFTLVHAIQIRSFFRMIFIKFPHFFLRFLSQTAPRPQQQRRRAPK